VGGFGFGAVITAPLAQRLMDPSDVTQTFLPLGLGYLVATLLGASFFRNPPEGYFVPGFQGKAGRPDTAHAHQYTLAEALRTPQWYQLTAILALNVTAGIALISQLSPAAQSISGVSPATASVLVGLMGLLNGGGRILWAALSDRIGRMVSFIGMLGLHALCFFLLPHAHGFALLCLLAAIIYLCYGGAFGTMPATAVDFFGTRNGGAVYGAMIVAWSLGGITGPLLTAWLLERSGGFTLPFTVIGIIAAVALVLPLLTRPPRDRRVPRAGDVQEHLPTLDSRSRPREA
jgi:OFA family oxalate/formate antiporter-like MFS transporter